LHSSLTIREGGGFRATTATTTATAWLVAAWLVAAWLVTLFDIVLLG